MNEIDHVLNSVMESSSFPTSQRVRNIDAGIHDDRILGLVFTDDEERPSGPAASKPVRDKEKKMNPTSASLSYYSKGHDPIK